MSATILGGSKGDKLAERQWGFQGGKHWTSFAAGEPNVAPQENPSIIPISVANCKSRAGNRGFILNFQSWRSPHDKYDLVTADLRQGNSKLAYPPAAMVLKALVALFTITAKDGPLKFKNHRKFTKDDHLVTSLYEIAGKAYQLTGRRLSERVVQKALLLLHREGLIYKTKGYYGKSHQCRLFIDLKGYRLYTKLDAAIYGCPGRQSIQVKRFPLAGEGEYGYGRKLKRPNTPEGADYLKCYNPDRMIEPGQTSPITAQNNVPNQIVHSKTENVPLARQPSIFEEPGKGNNAEQLEDRRWPEFSLTPQLQKILDFIQTHDVFVDKSGEPGCLERITAQEVSALIRAVETAGLTLGFLKKYWHAPFPGDEEEWFMRTSLGFFCDRFFLIKKLFYRMEAGEKLGGMPLPPSGNLVDIDYAADCFVYEARFRIPFCKDPSEYKNCVGGGEDRMQSGRLTMDRGFKCWRRFENSDGSHGHSQEGLGFCVSIDDPAAVY